jgi:hypothetical protein
MRNIHPSQNQLPPFFQTVHIISNPYMSHLVRYGALSKSNHQAGECRAPD